MCKTGPIAIPLAVGFLLFPGLAGAQPTANDIKLLDRNTGWALFHDRLFWTTDFGQHWRNITPPTAARGAGAIADVFFLDTSRGWTLLRAPDGKYGDWHFDFASTDDAGATWSTRPVDLPRWRPGEELGGGAALDFLDPMHGWMNLSLVGSTNFAPGVLYSTDDGGKTWQCVPSAPMIAARVRFVTVKDGWLAGGPGAQDLYATHNGGESWQRISLKAPPQAGRAMYPTYELPAFEGRGTGVARVFYSGGEGDGSALALFETEDGGRHWDPAIVVRSPADGTQGQAVPAGVVDSQLIIAKSSERGDLVLTVTAREAPVRSAVGQIRRNPGPVTRLSFRNRRAGWVIAGWLYTTSDAGATWTDITPKPVVTGPRLIRKPAVPNGQASLMPNAQTGSSMLVAAAGKGGGGGALHTSAHLGFHIHTALSAAGTDDMKTWWTYSPYYDIGVYLYLASDPDLGHGHPNCRRLTLRVSQEKGTGQQMRKSICFCADLGEQVILLHPPTPLPARSRPRVPTAGPLPRPAGMRAC